MKLSEIILGLLKIPMDFLMGILAFIAAYHLRTKTDLIPGIKLELDITTFPSQNEYLLFATGATLTLLIIFIVTNSYSFKIRRPLSRETGHVFMITATWFLAIIAYFFLIREFPFSRLVLTYAWLLSALLISFGRSAIRIIEYALLKNNIGIRRLIFIGNNPITASLSKAMAKDPKYKIVGVIDNNPQQKERTLNHLGSIQELKTIVEEHGIEEILQTKAHLSTAQESEVLDFCREHQLAYRFVPNLLSMYSKNVEVETMSGIPVIQLKPTSLDGWGRVYKRIFDLLAATAGLIILSPIFLIVAIAIKLDSKGTIFFKYLDDGSRVKRVGQKGKLFNFYKFRTMYPGTHNLRYTKLAAQDTRKDAPVVKIKDDPRITRIGKILRKTSIDELPQLFNVITGKISLVGPRAHLPEEVAKYRNHHKFVLTIKPGITGLAQISGRSDLDFEEEIRLDTYYIENWSPWLDLKIIFKTFGVIFKDYEE